MMERARGEKLIGANLDACVYVTSESDALRAALLPWACNRDEGSTEPPTGADDINRVDALKMIFLSSQVSPQLHPLLVRSSEQRARTLRALHPVVCITPGVFAMCAARSLLQLRSLLPCRQSSWTPPPSPPSPLRLRRSFNSLTTRPLSRLALPGLTGASASAAGTSLLWLGALQITPLCALAAMQS